MLKAIEIATGKHCTATFSKYNVTVVIDTTVLTYSIENFNKLFYLI